MKHWDLISKDERIERWENVLRVLRSLTPHERRRHWNMSNWGLQEPCGTIACAAGHCGLDPWFRRRGLKLKPFVLSGQQLAEFKENPSAYDGGWGSFSGNQDSAETVLAFFGRGGAWKIFYNGKKRPVGEVIKEVRAHIKTLKGV